MEATPLCSQEAYEDLQKRVFYALMPGKMQVNFKSSKQFFLPAMNASGPLRMVARIT
jgi:hypothetical protein